MDVLKFETLLLIYSFRDEKVRGRILPFLSPNLFERFENKELTNMILDYNEKYSKFPTMNELRIGTENKDIHDHIQEMMDEDMSQYDSNFMLDQLEDFFRKKLIFNTIFETREAMGEASEKDKQTIAESADRLRDALAFSFDTTVGLDFLEEGDRLYDLLHEKDSVISSGIKEIDKLIKGGFHEKSLTLFMAETNLGKSLIKTAFATNCLLQNKNVLYISLEMSEAKISERIIANLFDVEIGNIMKIPKDRFMYKFDEVKKRLKNRLVVKEFPTRSANTNRLRNLLKELKNKRDFTPDIIFVDYLGIMVPNKSSVNHNTNTELKLISEEMRGLAMEMEIPIVSSVQTNRGGFSSAEIDLTDIAESIGTTNTADVIMGVTQTDELREAGRYCFILLKNRYGLNKMKFYVGVDYPKMRLYDVENEEFESEGSKPINPVDDAAVNVLKTFGRNRDEQKKKIMGIDMEDE